MHTPARLSLAASLIAISFLAACSDSTGLKEQTAAQIATHFDSIAIQAAAQSDTAPAYGSRTLVASLIEIPAALGALPSTIHVTTADGVENWKAYELLPLPSTGDSSFILLAFRDADAHSALVIFFDAAGTGQEGGLFTGDTIAVNPDTASATTTLTSVGSTCSTPSASLQNPELGSLTVGTCNLATFRTSLAMSLPTTPGMDAALESLSFTNATVNGVRVVEESSVVRRAHDLLRAARANRHH